MKLYVNGVNLEPVLAKIAACQTVEEVEAIDLSNLHGMGSMTVRRHCLRRIRELEDRTGHQRDNGLKDSDRLGPLPPTEPLAIGETYLMLGGGEVTIVAAKKTPGYECVLGSDEAWRYNRDQDRGRVTGSDFAAVDDRTIIPRDA